MNLFAYLTNHIGSANVLVNLLIALLVLVILWYILGLFLPARVLQMVMAILALIVVLDLFVGCQTAPTPEQVQGWANVGHTVLHGAIQDAKDADAAYNQINH